MHLLRHTGILIVYNPKLAVYMIIIFTWLLFLNTAIWVGEETD